jgi:hypothetical protein
MTDIRPRRLVACQSTACSLDQLLTLARVQVRPRPSQRAELYRSTFVDPCVPVSSAQELM